MLSFIDITPKEYSFGQNLWCLILYIIIVAKFYNSNVCKLKKWNDRKYWHTTSLTILFLLYCLTNFVNHDYWSYYQIVKHRIVEETTRVEDIYIIFAKLLGYNYLLFRLTVWGLALWLFKIGAEKARLNTYHSLYLLAVCYIGTFSYGRVSLAMACVFTGYILCGRYYKNSFIKFIFGIILFLGSIIFHQSIIFAIAISIFVTFIPINKIAIRI